jgi:hypothetical protein
MEPCTEIQLYREAVNVSTASAQETMNTLADVLVEAGWPERCQVVQTSPDRVAVAVSAETLEAAADRVRPEWVAEGQFCFIPVAP